MSLNKSKIFEILKKAFGVIIIPLLCFVIMEIVCLANGRTLFSGGAPTFQSFTRGITYIVLLSLGVSINMHTGRFDFATGATMVISGVVGAQFALATGMGPIGMCLCAVVVGVVCGAISGTLYVVTKLPPMIIGLTMTLILEGVTAIITDGCKPIKFGTDPSYYQFTINFWASLVIVVLALAVTVILFSYTKFGYDYSALQTGQKISVNTGINEKKNAIFCYMIAGGLFGVAGALSVMSTNGITPTYNFSTIAKMFTCFLPLFFGGFAAKYINKQLGIFVGCIAYEFIIIGFGQLAAVDVAFTPDAQKVVEAVILVLFLIYTTNEHAIQEFVMLKNLRKKLAEKKAAAE
ncbi:MAG: hypothetical protein MJ248_05865 [Bacilli bacterium]|nr:hypothetical protein [Bacilli bacterium]